MSTVIGLPPIDGFASGSCRLERNVASTPSPLGNTQQRVERDGSRWRFALQCPLYSDEDAAVLEAWLDEVSRGDRWLYLTPPQNATRGNWAPAELVSNGTFEDGATTGWTASGATLSVNKRRLKVKNSGAAIGTATQTLTVTADAAYVVLVDLHPGSVEAWRIRLLDGTNAEEHVSYYDQVGRAAFVHIPASTTLKIELGCNSTTSGEDAKFGNVSVARCLLVNDSLAVGTTLDVKGGPTSTNAALKAGEFVSIRLWNGWQMVRLTEDLDTDSSGNGTLRFEPALRAGVLGGGPVVVVKPFARCTLDAPVSESSLAPPNFRGIALDAVEDVTAIDDEVPVDTDVIWHWDAHSLATAPVVGTGTPDLTADIDNWYFDESGTLDQVAATNTPVFEFDPASRALKGQRFQDARTNEITYAKDFSNAAWVKTNCTATAGIDDPEGGTGAYRISATAAAASLRQTLAAGSNTVRVNAIWIRRNRGSGAVNLWSPSTGSVVAATDAPHDEWTRYQVANAAASTTRDFLLEIQTSEDAIDVYFAQQEIGYFASSPISTPGSAEARAADVSSLILNKIIGYVGSEYTIEAEALFDDLTPGIAAARRYIVMMDDGTANENTGIWLEDTTSYIWLSVVDGGGAQAEMSNAVAITAGTPQRMCVGAKANDFAISQNGLATTTDSAGSMPSVATLRKMQRWDSTLQGNGWLRRLTIRKRKKPNRQIRSLSA